MKLSFTLRFGAWVVATLALLLSACTGSDTTSTEGFETTQAEPSTGDWAIEYIPSEPTDLNPQTSVDHLADNILRKLHYSLVEHDPATLQLRPVLAKALPEISEDGLRFTYEIRAEALWDNGTPVTGHDVAFTVKAIKNPLTESGNYRPLMEYVEAIEVAADNPKRFTLVANKPYFLAEYALGLQPIIPKYFYDPKGLMDAYTIAQLNQANALGTQSALRQAPNLVQFAESFNRIRHRIEPEGMAGCGPFRLKTWRTNQQIILERKPQHWTQTATLPGYLKAYLDRIIYKVIPNPATALLEIKAGKLDIMANPKAADFQKLVQDAKFQRTYRTETKAEHSVVTIALNNRPPLTRHNFFGDKRVRLAFAHLLNTELVIRNVYRGFAQPTAGPIPPSVPGYNEQLKPIPYAPETAKALLKEAGWADQNGDGILEKAFNGQWVPFEVEYLAIAGRDWHDGLAKIFAQDLKRVGIRLKINAVERLNYAERLENRDFDLTPLGYSLPPSGGDPKEGWHSASIGEGFNYWGYANPETDRVIDELRQTVDPQKRNTLYQTFQRLVHEDQPVIFALVREGRYVIHRRFQNAALSTVRPGYFTGNFWVPEAYIKYTGHSR